MKARIHSALALLVSCTALHAHITGKPSHDGGVAANKTADPSHKVEIEETASHRIIRSNGWPDHTPGQFPNRGNPNRLAEQKYEFRVRLKPEIAAKPTPPQRSFFGVALNGVPFEPGTAEVWNNDRSSGWHYQAMSGQMDLGLDRNHAHVQPNGAYHYHGLPIGLIERLGATKDTMTLVGWAADGFPIYAVYGYKDADDAKSEVTELKPSYRLKTGKRPKQANGPGGSYDGRFEEDFEYVEGLGDLDEFNGRQGVTPQFPEGTYYYVISNTYPFIGRSWRGTPDRSFFKSPPEGGRRRGRGRPGGRPPGQPPGGRPPEGRPPRR
ncbi:MAG: YHYH protein [Luteolibacter sp.]